MRKGLGFERNLGLREIFEKQLQKKTFYKTTYAGPRAARLVLRAARTWVLTYARSAHITL